ncbi:CatB-related O-acetyltransferase [Rhodoblastus acidophilus]|uniref:CatB-related O-acetyltransferase n=1 Tax=Candidatus Rhodoblastus alkanivorans TaxID=2954117 RepID=A0ABS9Z986_9HYPH|nr:CatB-related O-acetyltransferase [Candidatus Rhodoblastus alkanivorans]MCI4680897.1 CatB-related O-acetyltransferase [Candidatus Rhodoblastus alkanivorans]MCI4683910.1 CatB-related O-acetyltransferase [Candidatus Rhodoblastus alkanivorans]MDI4641228.1 CatB-related O-acetyltransferase [Rhodoblastus acidophilus]
MSFNEDVAFEDRAWIHLRATDRVAKAFYELNLFIGWNLEVPVNPSFLIRIPKAAYFENFTSSNGELYSSGAFSYSENRVTRASVGRYCSIANDLSVMGERHPLENVTSSSFTYCFRPDFNKPQFLRAHNQLFNNAYPSTPPRIGTAAPPTLQHDVWVGQNVLLQRGITLHTGCVVGAGAVVAKDVAPYTIVAGNPARPIRTRFPPELCSRLLATEWWNYHPRVLFEFGFSDVERFCQRMEDALSEGSLEPIPVSTLTWMDVLQKIKEVE